MVRVDGQTAIIETTAGAGHYIFGVGCLRRGYAEDASDEQSRGNNEEEWRLHVGLRCRQWFLGRILSDVQ